MPTSSDFSNYAKKYQNKSYGEGALISANDVLTGLLAVIGQGVNKAVSQTPGGMVAGGLGTIAGTQGGQTPNLSGGGSEQTLGPNQKIMKGLIDKQTKAHAEEALSQLGPDKAMQAAAQLDMSQQAPGSINQALTGGAPQAPQLLPAKSAFSGPSVNQATGDVNQQGMALDILHNILPAFFPTSTSRTMQQQNDLYTMAGNRQKVTGTEPIQPKDWLENNTKLMIGAMSKTGTLSDVEKNLNAYNTFGQKMVSAMDSYENLKAQGKTGPISGNFAKLMSTIGKGDQDLAEFDSLMTGLTFAGANFLAQQQGRSMSDADFKNVQKMIKLTNTSKDTTVRGKMQSVINQLNASVPSGGKKLPDVGTLIKEIKSARGGGVNQSKANATNSNSGKLSSGMSYTVGA